MDSRYYEAGTAEKEFEHMLRSLAPELSNRNELHDSIIVHFRGLEKKRRRKSRWRRTGMSLCAGLALILFFGGSVDYLGSNSFDLGSSGTLTDNGVMVFQTFNDEWHISAPSDRNLSYSEQKRVVETVYAMNLANQGEFVEVTGWTINGVDIFYPAYSYVVDGITEIYDSTPSDISKATGRVLLDFIQHDIDDFMLRKEQGALAWDRKEHRIIDGYDVVFERWTAHYPRWGEVVYWKGVPE